jgi:hypothetical protein
MSGRAAGAGAGMGCLAGGCDTAGGRVKVALLVCGVAVLLVCGVPGALAGGVDRFGCEL